MTELEIMGAKAKEASQLMSLCAGKKNDALLAVAKALRDNTDLIIEKNNIDIENGIANNMSKSLQDRLRLTPERIEGMAVGVEQIAAMNDPIGAVLEGRRLPNGLMIEKIRVPLGVIGIIYEARPNVTSDAAALCLKAGNVVILRGGKEAFNSNNCITNIMRDAIESAGLPADAVQLVQDTSRQSSIEMMELTEYLDVLIPRGGAGLINAVVKNSRVPVIQTGAGNCHVYVDSPADIDMAVNIIYNAKTSRPSVCNAIETVLVHKDIADEAIPAIAKKLSEKNVVIHGDERVQKLIDCVPATEEDWDTEYLDYELALKVVDSLDEAVKHIMKYTTGHSECIVTESYKHANEFIDRVDCAAVYVNASTRFTDGGMFGMGAEIGISTQKLHARGPMGLQQLTSSKFVIRGDGQIRE